AVWAGNPEGLGPAPARIMTEPPPPEPEPEPQPEPAPIVVQAPPPALSPVAQRFVRFLEGGEEHRALEAIPGNADALDEVTGRALLAKAAEAISRLEPLAQDE